MPPLPPSVHAEFPQDKGKLTPLFKQYTEIKAEQPQALLLYRLGDFYEMFGPDAVRGAELLGLTLTSRACQKGHKVAMCGVPHHSAVRYIKQLVKAGEAVALCEQTEDPTKAKGLVERAVTRVITAGTLVEDEYLSADSGNFLVVAAQRGARYGIALLESSGGRVDLCELPATSPGDLREALLRHHPAEVLLPKGLRDDERVAGTADGAGTVGALGPVFHEYEALPGEKDTEYFLERYFETKSLTSLGLGEAKAAQAALFALIRYLKETFKVGDVPLYPRLAPLEGQLMLDRRVIEHLELVSGLDPTAPGGGLYGLLNRCHTAAGRRELRRWLLAPSAEQDEITRRHDAVEHLLGTGEFADLAAAELGQLQDVERIVHRVVLGRTHPKELRALAASLGPLSTVGHVLRECGDPLLSELGEAIGDFEPLAQQIDALLADDPPVRLSDGGVIRGGADNRCDELRELLGGGQEWFAAYEQAERQRTGIRTLKVKHTDAFGYFIEVTKPNLALVPQDYERKQTLVNAERFTTDELARRETEVSTAQAKLAARERELFDNLCASVAGQAAALAQAAQAAAASDVLLALATVARELKWSRPQLAAGGAEDGPRLEISGGRHPLVERAVGERYYTRNDCCLDSREQQIAVLTGPNMGGKSTYLRMVALLAIINQVGGFVPAEHAFLPVFDRIYARVGAQDYLSRGQSTFMVEMLETAQILNTCGGRSLILLDEVGRGTSTYDGISIAKAVVEYLHEHEARPLVLFATHFFELTDLEAILPRVGNFEVQVARDRDRFVFLYRVAPGAASDSFGIEVAALAGLPESVVQRARLILRELEETKAEARERARRAIQIGLFASDQEN